MRNQQTNSTSICFQRWSRKNYAVFTSLSKVVKVGVLASGISMLSAPTAKAEKTQVKDSLQTDREQTLSELTVVGSKIESLQGLNTTLPVIKSGDVDRLPVISLESALRQSASIDIRERGVRGVQADLSIRGGSFDQSLVFLNGVNFTDSRTGHQNLGLPIDIEIIDQVNLLQGLTTPGALTGAINLITGASNRNFMKAEINSGQYGYQLYRLNGNYHYKNTNIFAAASHKRSEGYISNTDFETTNAFVHLKQTTKGLGNFDVQAGFQDKAFGSNFFYSFKPSSQYEETKTRLGSLGWNQTIGDLHITSNVNYKRVYDKYQWIRGTNLNFHRTDDAGASLLLSYFSALGKSYMGANYQYSHIYSNNMGFDIQNPIAVPGETNAFYKKEKSRKSGDIYLKHRVYWNDLQVEGNLNASFTPFGNTLLWGANAQYHATNWLKVMANANHNLRMPTFTDLFYKSSVQQSNPNLGMEKATTFDVGFEVNKNNFHAGATVFSRKIKNMIDWIKDPSSDSTMWHSVNYTEMNTQGLEVSAGLSFDKIVKDVRLSYSLLHSDKETGYYISKYALDYLKNKLTLSTQLALTKKLTLGVVGAYWERNGSYYDKDNILTPYDPYFTLDTKLSWCEKNYTIKVEGTNITNTTYYDLGGLRQPGHWFNAGIVVNL